MCELIYSGRFPLHETVDGQGDFSKKQPLRTK